MLQATFKVKASQDNVAGVKLPKFETVKEGTDTKLALIGLGTGGKQIQDCRKSFLDAVDLLVELASLQTAFLTLDEAIKTTNRRVNALEHVVKPKLENTIAYIKVDAAPLWARSCVDGVGLGSLGGLGGGCQAGGAGRPTSCGLPTLVTGEVAQPRWGGEPVQPQLIGCGRHGPVAVAVWGSCRPAGKHLELAAVHGPDSTGLTNEYPVSAGRAGRTGEGGVLPPQEGAGQQEEARGGGGGAGSGGRSSRRGGAERGRATGRGAWQCAGDAGRGCDFLT